MKAARHNTREQLRVVAHSLVSLFLTYKLETWLCRNVSDSWISGIPIQSQVQQLLNLLTTDINNKNLSIDDQ